MTARMFTDKREPWFTSFLHRRSLHAMRRMYNRIYRFYGLIERSLGPKIDAIIQQKIAMLPDASSSTALDYACGSGLLSLKLTPLFKSVTGRDLSAGMLQRAQARAEKARFKITFREGNILDIDEKEKSFDYVFISFALHLFAPERELKILKKLCSVARKAVIIIDHGRNWKLGDAIIEWMEGSYYAQFIKQDFADMAQQAGCRLREEVQIEECTVLTFVQ
jgi:ubiquinone/menaquinone biosynthesis C-methylase UbiE